MVLSQKNELPEGWANAKLGLICTKPQYGWTTSSKKNNGEFKLLRTSDISSGEIDWNSVPYCEKNPENPGKYLLKSNDIVISRAGSVGISHLISTCPPTIFASYLIRFQTHSGINPKFLSLFLKSPSYWHFISGQVVGIGLPNVNASKLSELVIPLPPLAEQHRIVAKIEALFSRLDAAEAHLKKMPDIIKRFRQAVLAAACDGRLTEDWRKETVYINDCYYNSNQQSFINKWKIPNSWKWDNLNNLCQNIIDCPHSTPKWTEKGYYCIRTSELSNGKIDFSTAKFVSENTYFERIRRIEPQEHDILYSREGTVGNAAIVPSDTKLCMGQRLLLFRVKNEINPFFFVNVLNSPYIFESVQKNVMGSTSPRINVKDIKKFPIPIPPLPEQFKIVSRIDLLLSLIDSLESHCCIIQKQCQNIRQSILGSAFAGKLVPIEAELAQLENREYEPASTLLERLKR